MKKNTYTAPNFEKIHFETEDILMVSNHFGDCTGEDIDWDGATDSGDKFWENWDLGQIW
jgi:hypothetical protein